MGKYKGRFCDRFYCDKRKCNVCCRDCYLRVRGCLDPCRNAPERCGKCIDYSKRICGEKTKLYRVIPTICRDPAKKEDAND